MAAAKPKAMGTKADQADAITQLFMLADKDGNGTISKEEMTAVLTQLGSFSDESLDKMFAAFDKNGDGVLQLGEFTSWLFAEGPYAPSIDGSVNKNEKQSYKSVEVRTTDLNTGRIDTFTVKCDKSLYPKVNLSGVDLTDSKLKSPTEEEFGWDVEALNISILVIDKAVPVTGAALAIMDYCLEMHELTVLVRPQDKETVSKDIVLTLLQSPELLTGALLTHLVLFPRMHFADLVLEPGDVTSSSLLTAASFGKFDARMLQSLGNPAFKGTESLITKRARMHHYVGKGFEEGEVIEMYETGAMPRFRTVMSCPASTPFALVIGDVFDKVNFEGGDAASNLKDLICEHKQYMPGSDE